MENLTPMLKQYEDIKAQHMDAILFFRLGDFYEMFYDDAKKASSILDLVLTSRGTIKTGKVPMCGIPYHSIDSYISKLIKAGLKIAICEQVEDPSQAKGIVRRDVTRIISSGTFIDENSIDPRYILALSPNNSTIGIAFTDNISGHIQTNQYPNTNKVIELTSKLPIYECIFPIDEETQVKKLFNHPYLIAKNIVLTPYQDWCFNIDIAKKALSDHFGTLTLRGFGIDEQDQAISSAGALLGYLKEMSKQTVRHIDKISVYQDSEYVYISPSAIYGLDIEGLIKTLDNTLTHMGKRKFRYWLGHPLKNPSKILERQSAVIILKESSIIREELGRLLRSTADIEKSLSRISCGYTYPKDFIALRSALIKLPLIQKLISPIREKNELFLLEDIPDIREFLENAINPDVPLTHPEGKLIHKGFSQELDTLHRLQENGNEWLQKLQAEEIKRTKINSLKIGFNNVFGYYIEITKPNLHLVPSDYIRKQTLVNAERFITSELKEFEEKMLSAEENILKIEQSLLQDIQKKLLDASNLLHNYSSSLSTIDVLYSLSLTALSPGYIAPKISEDTKIIIKDGRHPLVQYTTTEPFIPNDTILDSTDNHLLIITGPNMAGKSTYIRQVGILVILAQSGSFIPAASAEIGTIDKLFTRIGSHDEITKGQSTFMVEMSETADILNNFSPRSLIILDEIGRGTSTFDGLSIAWAVAEYIATHNIRTLFATHFHELTSLSQEFKGIKNYNIAVKEWKDKVIFLHKIIPGGTDDSYGIYVAKLAGIPKEVLQRSKQILTKLEITGNLEEKIRKNPPTEIQLSLFSGSEGVLMKEVTNELQNLDIDSITPLSALGKISEWKERLKEK